MRRLVYPIPHHSHERSHRDLTSESSPELVVVLRRLVVGDLSGVAPPIGVLKWFSSNVKESTSWASVSTWITVSSSLLASSVVLAGVSDSVVSISGSIGVASISTVSSTTAVSTSSWLVPCLSQSWALFTFELSRISLAQITSSSALSLKLLSQLVSLLILISFDPSCSLLCCISGSTLFSLVSVSSITTLVLSSVSGVWLFGDLTGVENGVTSVELSSLAFLTSPCQLYIHLQTYLYSIIVLNHSLILLYI